MTKSRMTIALALGAALIAGSFGAMAANLSGPQVSKDFLVTPYVIPIADSACSIRCERQAQQCRGGCGPQITCKQSCQSKMSACKSAC